MFNQRSADGKISNSIIFRKSKYDQAQDRMDRNWNHGQEHVRSFIGKFELQVYG